MVNIQSAQLEGNTLMPDLDKELTEAYIDGLRDRLNKKEVKLGRLQRFQKSNKRPTYLRR